MRRLPWLPPVLFESRSAASFYRALLISRHCPSKFPYFKYSSVDILTLPENFVRVNFVSFFFFAFLWKSNEGVDSLEKTDAGRHWGQEEKGTTEDEMAGWHH